MMPHNKTATASALLALALVVSCGRSEVTGLSASRLVASADRGASGRTKEIGNGKSQQIYHAATCSPRAAIAMSGVFGPGGGVLVFGESRLVIPGGALRDTVTISVTEPEGVDARVEFSPSGLRFQKPAGLVLSTAGCDLANPSAPSIVYLSPDGEVLETIDVIYDPHWKAIAAPIEHFSGYAIAF